MAVDAGAFEAGPRTRRARLGLSGFLWRRPWLKALSLLALPVAAFLFVYIGALAALMVSSFWTSNSFTAEIEHTWSLANYRVIFSSSQPYLHIAARTIGIAAAVTLTDAILAFPLAFFMARLAKSRTRAILFVMVLLPLWSSYLVRIYAWQTILAHDGAINWFLNKLGLPDQNIAYTNWAMWIVFSYVWLPFMILPVYAALERIPDSYLEASADLGARGVKTFRSVILPLALPGLVAGSIFTFALTLGDYITPLLVGGPSSQFIGNAVYSFVGEGNIPFAAALAAIPLAIMGVYLVIARRLGAFEAL
ncbi:MAG TPA: ABC transporter permease [Gaiellaceae bacterium]|nr:ABC transporter permease [Gaiellaceae bacterium]